VVQDHAAITTTYKGARCIAHSCNRKALSLEDGSNIVIAVKRLSLTCSKMTIDQAYRTVVQDHADD